MPYFNNYHDFIVLWKYSGVIGTNICLPTKHSRTLYLVKLFETQQTFYDQSTNLDPITKNLKMHSKGKQYCRTSFVTQQTFYNQRTNLDPITEKSKNAFQWKTILPYQFRNPINILQSKHKFRIHN